jgi:hypothetical protein
LAVVVVDFDAFISWKVFTLKLKNMNGMYCMCTNGWKKVVFTFPGAGKNTVTRKNIEAK